MYKKDLKLKLSNLSLLVLMGSIVKNVCPADAKERQGMNIYNLQTFFVIQQNQNVFLEEETPWINNVTILTKKPGLIFAPHDDLIQNKPINIYIVMDNILWNDLP